MTPLGDSEVLGKKTAVMPRVTVRRLADTPLPRFATAGAAGADVCACLAQTGQAEIVLRPGEFAAIPTCLAFAIPPGYEIQVRPRSGLALRYGVTVLNAPGTIDSDFRGEVQIVLINHGRQAFTVRSGDRIAQLVLSRVEGLGSCEYVEARGEGDWAETARGSRCFGSTGVR